MSIKLIIQKNSLISPTMENPGCQIFSTIYIIYYVCTHYILHIYFINTLYITYILYIYTFYIIYTHIYILYASALNHKKRLSDPSKAVQITYKMHWFLSLAKHFYDRTLNSLPIKETINIFVWKLNNKCRALTKVSLSSETFQILPHFNYLSCRKSSTRVTTRNESQALKHSAS